MVGEEVSQPLIKGNQNVGILFCAFAILKNTVCRVRLLDKNKGGLGLGHGPFCEDKGVAVRATDLE